MSENGQKVLADISVNPGRKAPEIASALGLEKRIVNGILYGELKGRVRITGDYHLSPVVGERQAPMDGPGNGDAGPTARGRAC